MDIARDTNEKRSSGQSVAGYGVSAIGRWGSYEAGLVIIANGDMSVPTARNQRFIDPAVVSSRAWLRERA
jgi:hypothetical protein